MNVCSSGPLGESFFQAAAFRGDSGQVKKLVEQGHNVNHALGDGENGTDQCRAWRTGRHCPFSFSEGRGRESAKLAIEPDSCDARGKFGRHRNDQSPS